MGSEGLFDQARELHLPPGSYALFGSAPLGIRGIRESHDIDIIMTELLWNEYAANPEWEQVASASGHPSLRKGDIELYKDWQSDAWDIPELIKEADVIDGLPFVRLQSVLEWKRMNGREKDRKDVELIERYMAEQASLSKFRK